MLCASLQELRQQSYQKIPISMAAAVKASGSLHIQQPSSKWQHAVKGAVRFEQVVKESVIVLQIMEQNTRRLLKVRCSLCMHDVFGMAAPATPTPRLAWCCIPAMVTS